MGSGRPITPVEATSTSPRGTERASAVTSTIRHASRRPTAPGQAFALPELVTIARALAAWICARLTGTGGATTRLVVNTPAAVAGRSDATRARSALPLRFMPQDA